MMYSYGHTWGSPWFNGGFGIGSAFLVGTVLLVILLALLALKGYALWSAAKRDEKWWFIAILVLNTLGILEAVYIIFFVKGWHKRMESDKKDNIKPSQPENPIQ